MVALNLRCGTESKWVRAEVDKVISKGEYAEDDFVCWLTDYGYSILSNSHYLQYLSKEIIEIPNDIIHMAGIENIIPIKKVIIIINEKIYININCPSYAILYCVTDYQHKKSLRNHFVYMQNLADRINRYVAGISQ